MKYEFSCPTIKWQISSQGEDRDGLLELPAEEFIGGILKTKVSRAGVYSTGPVEEELIASPTVDLMACHVDLDT